MAADMAVSNPIALLDASPANMPVRSNVAFSVEAWSACRNSAQGLEWSGAPGLADRMPAILRRRVTPLGQIALEAALRLPLGSVGRFIFSSRNGEYARTMALLDALACEEPVSPADFSLSVHHALAGLLSIAAGNVGGHTSIAARGDSFGYGLLDAALCLCHGDEKRILFVYFDAPLPADYGALCSEADTHVAAMVLGPARTGSGILLSFVGGASSESATDQAATFLQFLASGAAEAGHGPWRWHRAPA